MPLRRTVVIEKIPIETLKPPLEPDRGPSGSSGAGWAPVRLQKPMLRNHWFPCHNGAWRRTSGLAPDRAVAPDAGAGRRRGAGRPAPIWLEPDWSRTTLSGNVFIAWARCRRKGHCSLALHSET